MKNIKNFNPKMNYRRFGKTEEMISTITLGGMRYQKTNKPREEEPAPEAIEHCLKNVEWAFSRGINHIETAYGYGLSEQVYGKVLNDILKIPREDYLFMTKGWPKTGDETKRTIEEQLKTLKMDYFDFYAWHGINTLERLDIARQKGGPLDVLYKMKEEKIIKNIGFSTHAPMGIILKALETDRFDFVNLHYYYFFQRNLAAVELAQEKDMGVFIISPNDKGGQLFNPSPLIRELTAPLTPIQFNARFCLRLNAVHTLSFGMTEEEHYQEMEGIFPATAPWGEMEKKIHLKLEQQTLKDPFSDYLGYELLNDPSQINIPEILRFRKMWKCFDMENYGYYRYNMLESEGHWFPGKFATPENIAKIDKEKIPPNIPLQKLLSETHEKLFQPKK